MGGIQPLDGATSLTVSGIVTDFSGLSLKAEVLPGNQESRTPEFKESVCGLSSDALVSFANSETGGTILLGVREKKDVRVRQTTGITGCDIGDNAKLSILGRAGSCIPPSRCCCYSGEQRRGKTISKG